MDLQFSIYLPTYRISQKMLQIHKSSLQLHRSVYELDSRQPDILKITCKL